MFSIWCNRLIMSVEILKTGEIQQFFEREIQSDCLVEIRIKQKRKMDLRI